MEFLGKWRWMIALVVVLSLWSVRQNMRQRERMLQEMENEGQVATVTGAPVAAPKPPDAGRVVEVRKLMYNDWTNALATLDQIVAAPQSDDELAAARALLPDVLDIAFHRQADAKLYKVAEETLNRLQVEFPASDRTRSALYTWGSKLGQRVVVAAAAKDTLELEEAYRRFIKIGAYQPRGGSSMGDGDPLKCYAEFKLREWTQLADRDRKSARGAALLAQSLSALHEMNAFSSLSYGIVQQATNVYAEEVLERAKAFQAAGQEVPSFNAYLLAQHILQAGRTQQDPNAPDAWQKRAAASAGVDLQLAILASDISLRMYGKPEAIPCAMTPDAFLLSAANAVQTPAYRTCILRQRVSVLAADFVNKTGRLVSVPVREMCDESLAYDRRLQLNDWVYDARRLERTTFSEACSAVFYSVLNDTNESALNELDPAAVAAARLCQATNVSSGTVGKLGDVLRRMVDAGELSVPVPMPANAIARRQEVLARAGAQLLLSNREEAARALRPVIRESTNAQLRAEVKAAVESCILAAEKKSAFEPLIELAGFYAGEFGGTLGQDPFRESYRKVLESAERRFDQQGGAKAIFIKTLMASAFPDTEAGAKAQADSIRLALAAVAGVPEEADTRGDVEGVSVVAGYSSVAVDNATEYHILIFYEGPEHVAVLCNPYRRGTFMVKNGNYEVAVLAPAGGIRPYHGRQVLKDEHRKAAYHVVTTGGAASGYSTPAGGDYVLLRAAPGSPTAQADPKSGRLGVVRP